MTIPLVALAATGVSSSPFINRCLVDQWLKDSRGSWRVAWWPLHEAQDRQVWRWDVQDGLRKTSQASYGSQSSECKCLSFHYVWCLLPGCVRLTFIFLWQSYNLSISTVVTVPIQRSLMSLLVMLWQSWTSLGLIKSCPLLGGYRFCTISFHLLNSMTSFCSICVLRECKCVANATYVL